MASGSDRVWLVSGIVWIAVLVGVVMCRDGRDAGTTRASSDAGSVDMSSASPSVAIGARANVDAAEAPRREAGAVKRSVAFVCDGAPVADVVVRRLPPLARAAAPRDAPIVAVADAAGRAEIPVVTGAFELVGLADGFVAARVAPDEAVVEMQRTTALHVHVVDARGACAGVKVTIGSTRISPLSAVDVDLAPGECAIPAGDAVAIFCAVSGIHTPLVFPNVLPGRCHLKVDATRPFVIRGIEGWPPGLVVPEYRPGGPPKDVRIEVGEFHVALLHGVGDRILDARLSHDRPDDLHDAAFHAMQEERFAALRALHPDVQVLLRPRKDGTPFADTVKLLTERGGVVTRTVTFAPIDVATVQNVLLDGDARRPPVRVTIEAVDENGVAFHEIPFRLRYARGDGGTIDIPVRAYEPRDVPAGPVTLDSRESWVEAAIGAAYRLELSGAEYRHRLVVPRSHRLVRATVHAASDADARVAIRARIQQTRRRDGTVVGSMQTHRFVSSGGTFELWLEPFPFSLTLSADGHRETTETIVVEPGVTPFAFTRTLSRGK